MEFHRRTDIYFTESCSFSSVKKQAAKSHTAYPSCSVVCLQQLTSCYVHFTVCGGIFTLVVKSYSVTMNVAVQAVFDS